MKKVGFLYLDEPYMIYHSIGIAIELAQNSPFIVEIFCIKRTEDLIKKVLAQFNCSNIKITILRPYWYFSLNTYIELKIQLKPSLFIKYRQLFRTFDAFVSTKYNDLYLKKVLKNFPHIKYIFTNHGIPNRRLSFRNIITQYDLFFLLGQKERDKRKKVGQLTIDNHAIVGFLKYDVLSNENHFKLFPNNNPVFIYNPHWEKGLSSHKKFSDKVLSFFIKNKQFNLIYAPHAFLLKRNWIVKFGINKLGHHDNILVDTGSEMGNNMTYTKYADVYIGDASSQAMEFIYHKERPCIFLDTADLKNNVEEKPLSWQFGDIISTPDDFAASLKCVFKNFEDKYQTIQTKTKEEMFYKHPQHNPSQLASRAILKFLDNH